MPYEVFISYSHKDRSLFNEFTSHLNVLQRQKLISTWKDTDISPGTEWQPQIMDRLNRAQIILLLVSANFMDSDFCYSTEMDQAIKRHNADLVRVIPIIISPVYWKGAPFAKLQILPTDAKPVTSWPSHNDAFEDVVRNIAAAIDDLKKKGKAPTP